MALAAPAPTAPGLATGAPVHPSAIADGSQQALTHAIISVVPVANNVKKRPHWNAVGVTERAEMTRVLEGSAEIKVLKKNGSVVQVQDNARALGFVPANGSSFPAFATLDGARKTGAALAGLAKQSAAVGAWPVLAWAAWCGCATRASLVRRSSASGMCLRCFASSCRTRPTCLREASSRSSRTCSLLPST